MPILESKLDTRSEVFNTNKSDMLETLAQLQALYDEAAEGGGEDDADPDPDAAAERADSAA